MRKLLALVLLGFFGLPFLSAMLVLAPAGGEANLPVCCRRNGAHHCSMLSQGGQDGRVVAGAPMRCPFAPAETAPGRTPDLFDAPVAAALFAGLLSHPAVVTQTLASARISRVRANGKRGPPAI